MNNEDNLKPVKENLLHFLNSIRNTQFVIPVYQRNYIWQTNKQVKKFIDDYELVLKGSVDKHFIGILMFLIINRSLSIKEFSVVDGQQRLITIFLFLQSLKEIAEENGKQEFAEQIVNKYLTNPEVEDDYEDKLKLKPLVSDDAVYSKIIMNQQDALSNDEKKSNVYKNYAYIKNKLKSLFFSYSIEDLLEALDKFYFVIIPLGGQDKPQEIFETINSAGAELSKADLIRNFILMNIESNLQDTLYSQYWQPMEDLFAKNGKMENFFRMFLANQNYVLDNMEDIYNVFQEWFLTQKNECGKDTEEILKLIVQYANYYYNLFISNTVPLESPIKESLIEFKKSTIEPTAPILMEIYRLYETKDPNGNRLVSAESFSNIINLFNTYNIRRNLCNLRTGVLTRIVPPMLKDIIEDCNGDYSNIYNSCVKFLVDNNKGKASHMPDDSYMKLNLSAINAYALKSYLKVAFEKLESCIFNEDNTSYTKNPAIIDFSNLSIEHLMPQTITPEWYETLKINAGEYETQLNRIGNLTLATHSDNSRMSNNPYDYKREVLSRSGHLNMNREILEKEEWNLEEIEDRTNKLIDRICLVYPYESSCEPELKKYSIYYKKNNCDVFAYIYEDGTVEVQADSYIEKENYNNSEIKDYIEDNILISNGNGYNLVETLTFESLKKTSEVLFDSSNNMWEDWKDSNNISLNFELRAKIMNARND